MNRIVLIFVRQLVEDELLHKYDIDIKGTYRVEVSSEVTPEVAASIALDAFHSEISVKVLDDFEFKVLVDGMETAESDDESYSHTGEALSTVTKNEEGLKDSELAVRLVYQGRLGKYTVKAQQAGDSGIYDELAVGIFDPDGNCVGDVYFTLNEEGEPRVLLTTNGEGDGDHHLVHYPLRETRESVEDFE